MTDIVRELQEVLAGEPAWLVGGAVRDELLRRPTEDYDIAVAGDPRRHARALARALGGSSFALSEEFGGWRVVGGEAKWHVDLIPLRDGDLRADLGARDYTVNAMARPLGGGEIVDFFGGRRDLDARVLRMVSDNALSDDPVRTLRGVRFAHELGMSLEAGTAQAVRIQASGLERVVGERIFAELIRIVVGAEPVRGLLLLEEHGVADWVLPELTAMRGVEQNVFHSLDVHDHTLAVLEEVVAFQSDPRAQPLGRHGPDVVALLSEPLADGLSRGDALRLAALLHDVAKPQTRAVRDDGHVTFFDHDVKGAEIAASILRRMRTSEKLVGYVSSLTRHHLRLGYMVHERPLTRRAAWRYMQQTAPYAAETTVLTVADRLATRGRNSEQAIAAHLQLAEEMLGLILARRAEVEPPPIVRGDQLARELGIEPGPVLGRLLAQLAEDVYAGEISSPEQAVGRARQLLSST